MLLEFALVAPLLFALIFGIVDFGFAYNDWISVRQGSREGARMAVVGTFGDEHACSLEGLASKTNHETKSLICRVKERTRLDESDTRVKVELGCVQYPISSISGFFSPLLDGKVIESAVTMRIETVREPGLQNTREAPVAGNNWEFCKEP